MFSLRNEKIFLRIFLKSQLNTELQDTIDLPFTIWQYTVDSRYLEIEGTL